MDKTTMVVGGKGKKTSMAIQRWLIRMVVGCVLFLPWSGASNAGPFLPQSDSEVLERLPTANSAADRELRQLQTRLASNPSDMALATLVARRLLDLGRGTGDPRYYGYAQAALRPWWDEPQPSPAVLVLRATVLQHRHDFAGALHDLAQVLAQEPYNAQAWLSRAVILGVRGDYAEAQQSCLPLSRLLSSLLVSTCISNATVLSGQAERSYRLLAESLARSPTADVQERLWALTVLAETAARLGRSQAAEQHFQQALALGQRDIYLLSAYADFLLDQGRPEVVVTLLADDIRPDGLLLRLTLAERALGLGSLAQHVAELQARIAANRQRGDSVHQREEARVYLHLLDQPTEALRLAQANWAVQREPWDARLLLEAALATGKRAAAQPVLDWLASTGLEDRQLQRLAKQLGAGRP
jgi:tetratricopeptide (TPR) repeat protein